MFGRLLLFFLVVGVAEIYLLFKVGALIGIWWTLAAIVATAFLGAALTRMQGAATMLKAQKAMGEGRMPHAEALDGLFIIVAGAVLLTPGYITDVFGFLLLVPAVRAMLRRRLQRAIGRRMRAHGPPGEEGPDVVIEAEIIDD